MQVFSTQSKTKPYKRTPLLIAAYCACAAALINVVLGTGVVLTVGSAGLAVLLALAEIVIQVRRRRASAG